MTTLQELLDRLNDLPAWTRDRPIWLEIINKPGMQSDIVIQVDGDAVVLQQEKLHSAGYPEEE